MEEKVEKEKVEKPKEKVKEKLMEKPRERPKEKSWEGRKGREKEETLIRISATDIPGRLSVYAGLTKIKGISWAFSNAICKTLGIDKNRKVSTLTDEEIGKILAFVKNPGLPGWLLNRRRDIETGADKHLITTDLDLAREFDVRRMKKIRSYKGVRHAAGLPVRGQRTRAHFRRGRAIGVSRAKIKPTKKK